MNQNTCKSKAVWCHPCTDVQLDKKSKALLDWGQMKFLPTEVVALAIQRYSDHRYMLARRGPHESGAGNWEFPGGKIEAGETQPAALVREIFEEFQIVLEPSNLLFIGSHLFDYPAKTIHLHLWKLVVHKEPKMQLLEHDQIAWCTPSEMADFKISPADIYFINKLL